jgi:acetylornithine deacetylase/succinyl-diaminopimelate desuccinylase-like protein
VTPSVSNVIAGEIMFTVDVRDVRQDGIDTVVQKIEILLNEICNKRNLGVCRILYEISDRKNFE